MLFELKRRRLIRKRQLIIADKVFYNALNYLIGINRYKIVPFSISNKKTNTRSVKRQNNQLIRLF
jgi:hypothetical protein